MNSQECLLFGLMKILARVPLDVDESECGCGGKAPAMQ